jgi:hypothetical protein
MTTLNNSLRIKRLPFSRLLKSEMADYAEKTMDVFEKHDTNSEIINPVFDLLRAKTSHIHLLRLSYGIDTQRLKLNKLKGEMMLKISALKLKVRIISKSHMALDIHLVENAINSHLRYLNKVKNDKQLNQKVAGFLDLVRENGELSEFLNEHDLDADVQDINMAYSSVKEASEKRVEMLSQRPTVATKEIVKGMAQAIDNLFKGIEVGHLLSTLADGDTEGDQPNFVPLIDELNQLSNMYNRSISIRDANNKRKAQAGKENEGEEGDMGDDVPEMPEDKTPAEEESFRMTNTDFEDDLTDLETLGDFEEEY